MIVHDHRVDHLTDIGIIVDLDHHDIEIEIEIGIEIGIEIEIETEIENLDREVDPEEGGNRYI